MNFIKPQYMLVLICMILANVLLEKEVPIKQQKSLRSKYTVS